MSVMREVPVPTRGSGPVTCSAPVCRGHRERCIFGHAHTWSTWYENGQLQRTPDTYHCHRCGGVCIGDEEPGEDAPVSEAEMFNYPVPLGDDAQRLLGY